ncbi:MAG: hypothetical protein LBQ50_09275 [Planctomycetaceae bacterium]|jgi:hypothetical protein|nr:hypothetical protein [Planctomycetaceae bacterium]
MTQITRFYQRPFWTIVVFLITMLFFNMSCSAYRSFGTREFSWQLNAPKSNNPIFVDAYDHDFLWTVLVDVVDSHFEIEREMPVRLYGNVLTEGRLDTKPKIGASVAELWHADSVGFSERMDSTLQTIRRRVEVHVIPEVGGYLINVKVYKELEDNKNPLKSNSSANLRFEDEVDSFANQIDIDSSSGNWFIVERDTAMEDRLLLEIVYRLQHPSGVVRKSKEPIRG